MTDFKHEEAAAVDAAGSFSIGNTLRSAREARGETVADVAQALKLAVKQVEAMELERFDLLPGRAFVRGFLRNYARHLGLDAEQLIANLTGSPGGLSHSANSVELAPPKNARGTLPVGGETPRKGRSSISVIFFAMALVLGAGWYFDWFDVGNRVRSDQERTRSEILPPDTTAPAADALASSEVTHDAGSGLTVLTPSPVVISAADAPSPLEASTDAPTTSGSQPAQAASGGHEGDAAAPPPEQVTGARDTAGAAAAVADAAPLSPEAEAPDAPVTGETVAQGATEGDVAAEAVTEPVEAAGPGQLVFQLRGESWIQVRDADGTTLYMGTSAAGTTRRVQGTPPFSIVVGNASEVSLEHAGKPVDLAPFIRTGVARVTVE